MSRKVEIRPRLIAAPFCSLIAGQIAEVQPLNGLLRVRRRAGRYQSRSMPPFPSAPRAPLICSHSSSRWRMCSSVMVALPSRVLVLLLLLDQAVHAVQRHAAVVADDAAAAVGVRQAGDACRRGGRRASPRCMRRNTPSLWVLRYLETRPRSSGTAHSRTASQALTRHAHAAEGIARTRLSGASVCKPDDHLVFLVEIARADGP